jgi:hypothetical protein
MTDARIIIWFTWFVAASWMRNATIAAREWLLNRAPSMTKSLSHS